MDMGMLNEEDFYQMLYTFRANGVELTEEQKQFVMDYALTKFKNLLADDPNVMAVFKRLADK